MAACPRGADDQASNLSAEGAIEMDPLLLFAATVVTDESRAPFAAARSPVARRSIPQRPRRTALAAALLRPTRRPAAAGA